MTQYVIRRLGQSILTLFGLTVVIFLLVRIIPGDPIGTMVAPGTVLTQETVDAIRESLGLDQPLWKQYLLYLQALLSGDLGQSYQLQEAVARLIFSAAPATIELALGAAVVALVFGITLGIVSAIKQYSPLDYGTMVGATIGIAAPVFWIGLLLILIFSVNLQWLPSSGRMSSRVFAGDVPSFYVFGSLLRGDMAHFTDGLRHLILPSVTLGFANAALIARITRSAMLDVLSQNYITTARAKGLSQRVTVLRHALQNALIPVITIIGLQFGYLLGGAVLTETVFNWPGLGSLLVGRVGARDYPVVQGIVLVVGLSFVFINLIVDLLYGVVDPRVHRG